MVLVTGVSFKSAWPQVSVCVSLARPSTLSLGVAEGTVCIGCCHVGCREFRDIVSDEGMLMAPIMLAIGRRITERLSV